MKIGIRYIASIGPRARDLNNKAIVCLVLFSALSYAYANQKLPLLNFGFSGPTTIEDQLLSSINSTNIYQLARELEQITLDVNLSGLTCRSAGSRGADIAAEWIGDRLEDYGLETRFETFEFANWSLLFQPTLIVDTDGDATTQNDQVHINSFRSAHFSPPTPEDASFQDLVYLPLPEGLRREDMKLVKLPTVDMRGYLDSATWNSVNTTGKILLIGREVTWYGPFRSTFIRKMSAQPPAAVIYTWRYEWMRYSPPIFDSYGDRLLLAEGIPTGWVDYDDGQLLLDLEKEMNVSANVCIPSAAGTGMHLNVVGKLAGSEASGKTVIVASHYDTVLSGGFCDGGAGTAGLLELARVFSEAARQKNIFKDTLLFISFTAEELGLVGSVEYIKQHKSDLRDIRAVFFLGGIGNKHLKITETLPEDNGFSLQETVEKVAVKLNVGCEIESQRISAHEAFRNPAMADAVFYRNWQASSGINDTVDLRIRSSVLFHSRPLTEMEADEPEEGNWFKTEYDNSTTPNWVEPEKLGEHVRVVALSIVQTLDTSETLLIFEITLLAALALTTTLMLWRRLRLIDDMKKAWHHLLSYIEGKELVYIAILTCIMLFSSLAGQTRVTKVEILKDGFSNAVTLKCLGYPFEMVATEVQAIPFQESGTLNPIDILPKPQIGTFILWKGLVLDLIILFMLSLGIVYVALRIRTAWELRTMAQ